MKFVKSQLSMECRLCGHKLDRHIPQYQDKITLFSRIGSNLFFGRQQRMRSQTLIVKRVGTSQFYKNLLLTLTRFPELFPKLVGIIDNIKLNDEAFVIFNYSPSCNLQEILDSNFPTIEVLHPLATTLVKTMYKLTQSKIRYCPTLSDTLIEKTNHGFQIVILPNWESNNQFHVEEVSLQENLKGLIEFFKKINSYLLDTNNRGNDTTDNTNYRSNDTDVDLDYTVSSEFIAVRQDLDNLKSKSDESYQGKKEQQGKKGQQEIKKEQQGININQDNPKQRSKKTQVRGSKKEEIQRIFQQKDCLPEISIGKEIGAGQHGIVYEGTVNSKVIYALKEAKIKKEELKQECQRLKSLKHQHIIKCYGMITIKDREFMLLDYKRGGSLLNGIKQNDKFTEFHFLNIIHNISSALAYISERGLIHRDIRCDNILFENDQNNGLFDVHTFLSDFGLARGDSIYSVGPASSPLPYAWMAPEVYRNLGSGYNSLCDVYSFGMLCNYFFNYYLDIYYFIY